jgi:excisionase family DNA binding protein
LEDFISTKEAAELLGISRVAVSRLISRGTLAASFVGAVTLLRRSQVRKLALDEDYLKRTRRREPRQLKLPEVGDDA